MTPSESKGNRGAIIIAAIEGVVLILVAIIGLFSTPTINVYNNGEKVSVNSEEANELITSFEKENAVLREENDAKEKENLKIESENLKIKNENESLSSLNKALSDENEQQKVKIEALEAQSVEATFAPSGSPNSENIESTKIALERLIPLTSISDEYSSMGDSETRVSEVRNWIEADFDNAGNPYNSGIYINVDKRYAKHFNTRIEYSLEGKYDTFSGLLVLAENQKNEVSEALVEVYADEKLLFTSEPVVAGVLPQLIDVKISGAKKLKIIMRSPNSRETYKCRDFGIVNCFLHSK